MKILTLSPLSLLLLPHLAHAAYVLQDDYNAQNFLSKFTYFTGSDPTHGFVKYVDEQTAKSKQYVRPNGAQIHVGVDHKSKIPFNPADKTGTGTGGRESVRLESKTLYTKGLFILDIEHMPGGPCGTWPAFWTVGGGWPNKGEIDIIEGVHRNSVNMMALHTGPQCSVKGLKQKALVEAPNCDVKAPGQASNQGCSMKDKGTASYGDAFNAAKGGVFAMEWTSTHIKVWFFPRGSIPKDINTPNPASWGTPNANFEGGCEFDKKFKDHKIIFNTTFCGDWAGGVWGTAAVDGGCGSRAKTCVEFVANNPQEFEKAYWTINYLKVFKQQ
ncbi:uncharacterized protein LAJ45_06453 [Morchella importuna]|uniref:uncharacterized protein n=1 Tax=Morchella importuna TaxID=1174673 RepID=UPI001E8EBAF9|nr:uncharacterized protein LAJ45_06453 [Morchella importuna]KAH8149374.1 hypothetical protein LAJ45_06453 [Morchella importuna]